jgi:hypothetical protein
MSKISKFIKDLADDIPPWKDPMSEDFFDPAEYQAKRLAEEPAVIEAAINSAKRKQEVEKIERDRAPKREIKKDDWMSKY